MGNVNIKMNRKGQVSIGIFVLLAVLIMGLALFKFVANPDGVDVPIEDARLINDVYDRQDEIDFYIIREGEKALVESYIELIDSGGVSSGTEENGIYVFDSFDEEEFNVKLNDMFREKFKARIEKYDFLDEGLKRFKEEILEDRFRVEVDSLGIGVSQEKFPVMISLDGLSVIYRTDLNVSLNFEEKGLHGFKDIFEVSKDCVGESDMKSCLELGLTKFDADVSDSLGKKKIVLTSKKDFVLDGEFVKLEVMFLK